MKPLSEKMKLLLKIISDNHFSVDEYIQLAQILLHHASWMKALSPVEKMLADLEGMFKKVHVQQPEFILGDRLDFRE